jgi:hypothetical protein
LNATIKGLITGVLMVVLGLILSVMDDNKATVLQYAGTFIYGLGIVWSVMSFASATGISQFGILFQQGFRCFVMATLVLAIYTFVYWKTNPEKIDQIIEASKVERLQTAQHRTPQEIEIEAQQTRKYFIPISISGQIFSNLLVGAVVTMVVSGVLYLRGSTK